MINRAISEIQFFTPNEEQREILSQYSEEAIRYADNSLTSSLKSPGIINKFSYFVGTAKNYSQQKQSQTNHFHKQHNQKSVTYEDSKYRRLNTENRIRNELKIPKLTSEIFHSLIDYKQKDIEDILRDNGFTIISFFENEVIKPETDTEYEKLRRNFMNNRKVKQETLLRKVKWAIKDPVNIRIICDTIINLYEISQYPIKNIDNPVIKEIIPTRDTLLKQHLDHLFRFIKDIKLEENQVIGIIDIIYDEITLPDSLKDYKKQTLEEFYIKLIQKGDK